MLFLKKPALPKLRVWQMPVEDRRTYITERVDAMLGQIKSYRIEKIPSTTYLGVRLKQCLIFEHAEGNFKVIDWSDRDYPEKMESGKIINHPNCQFVLKCQYNPVWRVPKLRPFFYFEKTRPRWFSEVLPSLRQIPKTNRKLYWRGNLHEGREAVLDGIADLLNPDYKETVSVESFYEELASYRLAVSLPGLGKSCHREFECFAIGTVVISPKFQNICHAPLIPNYHYIEAEDIRTRLQTITEDEIEFVRRNAMTYYDTYIRFESSVKLLPHLLEL
jgi:hypothetical protein